MMVTGKRLNPETAFMEYEYTSHQTELATVKAESPAFFKRDRAINSLLVVFFYVEIRMIGNKHILNFQFRFRICCLVEKQEREKNYQ